MSLQITPGFTQANQSSSTNAVSQQSIANEPLQNLQRNLYPAAVSRLPDVNANVVDAFNPIELERYHYLLSFYSSDDSQLIVQSLSQYGLNTWSNVCSKIEAIMDHNLEHSAYMSSLKDSINIGHQYSTGAIIIAVGAARRTHKLKPYLKDITKACVNDFLQSYMAEVVLSEVDDIEGKKRVPVAYIPIVNLEFQA